MLQYAVQQPDVLDLTKGSDKLHLIKGMNHMVPALVAMKYGVKGWVGGSSMSSGGGGIAIGEAFRLVRDGYVDRVLVGGLDLNVN